MTAGREERLRDRQLMSDVRARVWQWDPIGLAETGAPEDEYDCLVGPISSALRRGASAAELSTTLDSHISDHFGAAATGTPAFVEELVKWHSTQSARPSGTAHDIHRR